MNRLTMQGRMIPTATAIIAFVALMILGAGSGWSAVKYGDAILEKGAMTVLREGRTLRFDQANEQIVINENDLIRVRPASRVVLNSREKASLVLGGNSVFHVKPWQSKGKTGFMRALFGKFRASVVGLLGGEQFNVKTATATIGVKGSGYRSQVTNRGGTLLLVEDHTIGLQGQRGPEVDVPEGFVSLTITIFPSSPATGAPQGLLNKFGSDDLDSGGANSPGGGSFVGEKDLVDGGLVDQGTLDDGKGSGGGDGFSREPIEINLNFDPNAAHDALQRGRVRLEF